MKTTGSDTFIPLLALTAKQGAKVAFIGSTPGVLAATAEKLKAQIPAIDIIFAESPPFGFNPESQEATELLQRLNKSGAQLCFLALGAPKQEILASRGLSLCPATGFVSVGASLDFVAGTQKRAPKLVQKLFLEWFWRLCSSPKRLGQRYAACACLFPFLLVRSLRAGKQRP